MESQDMGHPMRILGVRARLTSLGAYFINVDGQRAIRAKRTQ
ncbi:MAG: hypothetical protein ABI743_13525 [bacterium]